MSPRLNAIGLVVQDMARSLAFYRALGLEIPAEADGQPHVDVPFSADVHLLLDTIETIRSFDPEWDPPRGSARVSLAFQLDGAVEVDALYERLMQLGFAGHKEPWDAFWGQRYACVLDPDGNGVDLYAPLPAPSPTTG